MSIEDIHESQASVMSKRNRVPVASADGTSSARLNDNNHGRRKRERITTSDADPNIGQRRFGATIMNAMRANAQTRTIAVKNIKNAIKLSVLRVTTTITITEQTSKVDPTTDHARGASKHKARHSVLMDNDHKSHKRAKSKLQMRVLHTYL